MQPYGLTPCFSLSLFVNPYFEPQPYSIAPLGQASIILPPAGRSLSVYPKSVNIRRVAGI